MSPNLATMAFPRSPGQQRLACISALLLVFLCGAVAGALAMNLGAHKVMHKAAFWTDSGKAATLERMKKELDLSPAQTSQLEGVLDDFAKYYQTVLSDGKSRIMSILNDSQKHKFEQILQSSNAPH